ncbi:hypothetical protein ACFY8X_39255 [Streptomyces tanashiensis]|uniref:hypothetical protein n=1 Tax=Streptomyces tanashiensis TaxID=67367 RepID=UPI0036EF4A0C
MHSPPPPALVRREARYSEPRVLRRALYSWAFNKRAWESEPSAEWQHALDWMKRHSLPVSDGLQEHSNRLIEESMQEWSRRSEDSSPNG